MRMRHPDLFIPTAMIDPETTTPARLAELRDMGYRGLKMIGVAPRLRLPGLLPDVREGAEVRLADPVPSRRHRRRHRLSRSRTRAAIRRRLRRLRRLRSQPFSQPRNISATRMRPFHLDTIANNFPNLKLIGAHLGGTGNYDEAASVARWRHNVYFDFSGGATIERHAVERRLIGHEIGFEKLIFGSDTAPDKIVEHVRRWDTIFDLLDVPEDARERLWWYNGAELYGEEPIAWMKQPRAKAKSSVRIVSPKRKRAPARKSAAQRSMPAAKKPPAKRAK